MGNLFGFFIRCLDAVKSATDLRCYGPLFWIIITILDNSILMDGFDVFHSFDTSQLLESILFCIRWSPRLFRPNASAL